MDNIVMDCYEVFDRLGHPDAISSQDLVRELRQMPGPRWAPHWPRTALTQRRLAELLAPYEVFSRDVTLPDGRRRKSYRRSAIVGALQELYC
nr:DUF3631 domain-containing protein [Streptomyces sp. YIM 98790]